MHVVCVSLLNACVCGLQCERMSALLTSTSDVRQVTSSAAALTLIHSPSVFCRHRARGILELLLLLLLLLRALLGGGRRMLQVQLADLGLRLLLGQGACPRCYTFSLQEDF